MFGSLSRMCVAGASVGSLSAGAFHVSSNESSTGAGTSLVSEGRRVLPVLHAESVEQPGDSSKPAPRLSSSFVPFSQEIPVDTAFKGGLPSLPDYAKWDKNWDKRDPELMRSTRRPSKKDREGDAEELQKPTASRRLILIRHGQYNLSSRLDKERTLTDTGHEQANVTASRLKAILGDTPPDVLIHSTMTRATQTFQPFHKSFGDVEARSCDLLREGAPYPPDPPSKTWRPELHQFFTDGARIEAAFRRYFHRADVEQEEDSVEVIICHANVIRYFVCRALQISPAAWLRISLAHCSLTVLDIRPSGRVTLRALGDSGHLSPNLITFQ